MRHCHFGDGDAFASDLFWQHTPIGQSRAIPIHFVFYNVTLQAFHSLLESPYPQATFFLYRPVVCPTMVSNEPPNTPRPEMRMPSCWWHFTLDKDMVNNVRMYVRTGMILLCSLVSTKNQSDVPSMKQDAVYSCSTSHRQLTLLFYGCCCCCKWSRDIPVRIMIAVVNGDLSMLGSVARYYYEYEWLSPGWRGGGGGTSSSIVTSCRKNQRHHSSSRRRSHRQRCHRRCTNFGW